MSSALKIGADIGRKTNGRRKEQTMSEMTTKEFVIMIKCTRIDCPFIGVKECTLEKCPYKTNNSKGADDDNA